MKEYEILLEMVSRLEEIQQDLFCSGFCSVPEYVSRSLSELSEEAESYGMAHYKQRIVFLLERLDQTRHMVQKNGAEVMEAYVWLYQFNQQLKRRLRRDKMRQEMLISDVG